MASLEVDKFSKLKAKIQQKLLNGEFYEAHQLYKTLHFRLCGQLKYNEAIDVVMDGALELFKAKQMSSATDLALIVIELLEKSNALANSENIARVSKLHQMIAPGHIERPKFVGAAMNWSKKFSPPTPSSAESAPKPISGSAILHGEFGITYWHEKDYVQARHHLVRSQEGEACAAMLIEYQITCGFPNEVDLFIAQAVLQFLCMQNRNTAEICFNKYTSRHPQVEPGPPYIRPLLNFLWLLLLAVDRGNLTVFTVLCEQYDYSLKRDPSYHDYLAKIAQLFFNVPLPPQMNNFGILGNIMPELLRNDSDDEERMKLLPVELD